MKYRHLSLLLLSILVFGSCGQTSESGAATTAQENWKEQFNQKLPLLGHRNWILIVDKAFPEQNAAGIVYINTNEKLLPVLRHTLGQLKNSGHVRPIVYCDKELNFISEQQVKGVDVFRKSEEKILGTLPVQTLLHDSVFKKLDESSKLFKIVVLKTNETIPYSSVFMQLDCAYWSAEKEAQLRKNMVGQ